MTPRERLVTVNEGAQQDEVIELLHQHRIERVLVVNDDFDTGREDDLYDFGLGVNYAFRWWMSVGARYNYLKRDSNLVVDGVQVNDYEENIIGLTL